MAFPSLGRLYTALLAGSLLWFLFCIFRALYYVYLHPLRKYPGPKLWAATRLIWVYHQFRGDLIFCIKRLHEQYGPVVRICPDELSITSAAAWKDLHSKPASKQLPRDRYLFPPPAKKGVASLLFANNEQHGRLRRQLAYAFSTKALEEQQPMIQSHIDTLMRQLGKRHGLVNLVDWFNFVTFDVITDLAFGESVGNLENGEYHQCTSFALDALKGGIFASTLNRFGLLWLAVALVPASLRQRGKDFSVFVQDSVAKRLDTKTDRPDFISYMSKAKMEDRTMTRDEITVNAVVFLIAGSESTSTHLTGTVSQLAKDPTKLSKAVNEVRSTFQEEKDINISTIPQLPYLNACLEESLRICPPAPFAMGRITAEPTVIAGVPVPANVTVSIPQYAAWTIQDNFTNPEDYLPERWLNEKGGFEKEKQEAFYPFSLGPRNCMGQNLAYLEARLVLARLLWNFDLELADPTFEWTKQKAFLVWEKKPLVVRLKSVR